MRVRSAGPDDQPPHRWPASPARAMAARIRIGIAIRAAATRRLNIRALLPACAPVDQLAVDPVEECPVRIRRGQCRVGRLAATYHQSPVRMISSSRRRPTDPYDRDAHPSGRSRQAGTQCRPLRPRRPGKSGSLWHEDRPSRPRSQRGATRRDGWAGQLTAKPMRCRARSRLTAMSSSGCPPNTWSSGSKSCTRRRADDRTPRRPLRHSIRRHGTRRRSPPRSGRPPAAATRTPPSRSRTGERLRNRFGPAQPSSRPCQAGLTSTACSPGRGSGPDRRGTRGGSPGRRTSRSCRCAPA